MGVQLHPDTLDLTVVLPCLNEAANLRVLLPSLRETLGGMDVSWEILVIDGPSTDDNRAVVEEHGARYIRDDQRGYGRAIIRGFEEALGTWVLTMDADLSHPSGFVPRLWEARERGDIVIASRYVPGGKADQPWARLMLSKVLNGFLRTSLTMEPLDLSSGFRLYRKRMLRGLEIEFTNFAVLVEILLKAFAKGAIITETPFHYQPRIEGVSHARIVAFGMDYLRLLRRMWGIRNSVDFPDYDWRAHDGRIWFQRYWQRKRHSIIMRFAPKSGLVCDIGCGSSHILADLPHAIGIDLRLEKLRFMRPRHHGALMQGDGMALPFADASLDGIISSEIIEHIPDENGRHIDELLRVLKPGGIMVLGTPDYGGWQWPFIEGIYGRVAPGAYAHEHVNPYSRNSLLAALKDRGCEILDEDAICRAELIVKAKKAQ